MPYSADDVKRDVETIRKATKGFGCDEKAVIGVVGPRTAEELQELSKAYISTFGQPLLELIDKETSGDFKKLLGAVLTEPTVYAAQCLESAMAGLGTDEGMLIETLTGRSNAEIAKIKEKYKEANKKDLDSRLSGELSGDLKRYFIAMIQANRNEAAQVQPQDVEKDVETLYKAGEGKIGTDEGAFCGIFASRSYEHLAAVFNAYEQKHKSKIEKVIDKEFSGDIGKALRNAAQWVVDKHVWAAEQLEASMAGMGTNEKKLIRLIARFHHTPLAEPIKAAYLKKYGQTLGRRIAGEISGDFKKLALALIGESA